MSACRDSGVSFRQSKAAFALFTLSAISSENVNVVIKDARGSHTTSVTNNHEYLDPLTQTYKSIGKYKVGEKVVTASGLGEIVSIATCIDGTASFEKQFTTVYALNLKNGEKNYLINDAVVESTERTELIENAQKAQLSDGIQFGFYTAQFENAH